MEGNTPTSVGKTTASKRIHAAHQETPPRAWGRPHQRRETAAHCGNTPTGVGKTLRHKLFRRSSGNTPTGVGKTARSRTRSLIQKHPHGRGEDKSASSAGTVRQKHPHGRGEDSSDASIPSQLETPPRAWGRLLPLRATRQTETPPRAWGNSYVRYAAFVLGNTPTGVGKTDTSARKNTEPGKHPHGRGEDRRYSRLLVMSETPPRAWGRPNEQQAGSSLETPPRAWGRLSSGCCN